MTEETTTEGLYQKPASIEEDARPMQQTTAEGKRDRAAVIEEALRLERAQLDWERHHVAAIINRLEEYVEKRAAALDIPSYKDGRYRRYRPHEVRKWIADGYPRAKARVTAKGRK